MMKTMRIERQKDYSHDDDNVIISMTMMMTMKKMMTMMARRRNSPCCSLGWLLLVPNLTRTSDQMKNLNKKILRGNPKKNLNTKLCDGNLKNLKK